VNITNIHRYLSGEASEGERKDLERWLEMSEENQELFSQVREIYNVKIEYRFSYDKEAALNKFKKVMEADSSSAAKKSARVYHAPKRKTGVWLKIAALFLAVAGISIYLVISSEYSGDEPVQEVAQGVTVETEPGEQKSFRLSDGSRVRLNAASSIYIPTGFGTASRVVELSGEAFFEVEPGHELEFKVVTEAARIAVLGTSFTVRAWQDREESVIAVQTGRVSVRSAIPEIEDQTILTPGEYSTVRRGEAPGPALQANVDQFLGWTNQMFVFEETPLMDVLRQLELHFNVSITVSDSSSIEDPVTARYRDESLEEILRFTSITHGVDFTVKSSINNNQ
jgi:transmembrane sensor